jgi:hypothetical protein
MPGQFTAGGTRPPLPGAYFDFQVVQQVQPPINTLGTVAIPLTHSWGPANTIVTLNSLADFNTYFGTGGYKPPNYSPGYKAVYQAFLGEGLPGRGGAARVLAYRMVGSAGASSTLTIQNTSPANALTLTAKYPGSFGNQIAYTNTANARNPSTQSDLNIYVNGLIAETYTYNKTDIVALAAAINASSQWVTALEVATGTALAVQATPTSLASGNDGSTLVAQDWTNMMAAFGIPNFSLFAPFDLEDSSILASLVTWAQGLNNAGNRFMTVVGGPSSDTAATAATRSASIDDPNFVNIGVGTYQDGLIGTLNTAQLAPRLAGIMAGRGDSAGLSFARLANVSILTGASASDILASISAGWMAIGQDSNANAPVRFEKGVTTFTDSDPNRPLYAYGNPKFVRTMQDIQNTITQWAEFNVVGLLPVTDQSVQYVLGFVKAYFKSLEANQVIQPGWLVQRNPSPPPTPQDDFISILYKVSFARDAEQVLNVVTVT